jgi:hypothetical protein
MDVRSWLTPQFFDSLVIGTIIAGLILAAARIIHDFRSGPRWPASTEDTPHAMEDADE